LWRTIRRLELPVFGRRSCSNKGLERDDDSKKNHPAPVTIMLYSLPEAAKQTGLSEFAILGAIEGGRIVGTKDLFGEWHIDEKDLRTFDLATVKPDPHQSVEDGALRKQIIVRNPADNSVCSYDADAEADQPQSSQEPSGLLGSYGYSLASTTHDGRNASLELQESRLSIRLTESRRGIHSESAWDEISLDDREKIPNPVHGCHWGIRTFRIKAILLLALGWTAGVTSYYFFDQTMYSRQEVVKVSDQRIVSDNQMRSLTDSGRRSGKENSARPGNATSNGFNYQPHRQPRPQILAQQRSASKPSPDQDGATTQSIITRQQDRVTTPPVPFPETRPTTISGWTLRGVVDGTALLDGPYGTWKAARGDTVPGLGRVDSIVLWGNRWIVATDRGLVTTP
jgi:hypothetical protein